MVIALSMGELLLKVGVIEVKVKKKFLHMNMWNTKIQASAVILDLLKMFVKDLCAVCLAETDRSAIFCGGSCMGEQEMQWYQWLTKPRPQV